MVKTGQELANFAISTLGQPYMYGVNGLIITEALIQAKAKQYPAMYSSAKIAHLRTEIGKRAYQCNSYTSIYLDKERSANGWLAYATEKGPIETMPKQVGVTVHYYGHMGVYIGNGEVLEARGTFYEVVITKLAERPWKSWAKYPEMTYEAEPEDNDIMLYKGCPDGEPVYEWQSSLVEAGFKMINNGKEYPPDGKFGTATENGTNDFKASVGLARDGKVDSLTYGRMLKFHRDTIDSTEKDLQISNGKVASLTIEVNILDTKIDEAIKVLS